ncbi:MAG TPA: Na/Pi cotransporter family protein [Anaerolineae bacterium]|nr:Na/Pi cotransporter family protein [Anaerolineae bacterium]HQH37112.1 Na/Pi cotransporter family protein [Anaerolineae bacterium]
MINILQVLAGMAFFIFGISMLSGGMEKLTGSRIQEWLDKMTGKPLRGAFFGAAATALIQSSGLLMVTMIGLINANLMTLNQAIGVMLGQEIGTTLTAQLVAFKIGNLNTLFIIAGVVLVEFFAHRNLRTYGEVILGVGIIFLGMDMMAGALQMLVTIPEVAQWLATLGHVPLAGVLAGTIATAVVQSSSAVTSLLVAMGMSGAIELRGAIALLLGANIGSCVMGLLASLRLSRSARRASIAQILINVIGVLLFLPFITPYAQLISHTSTLLPRQIANAHTIFNMTISVVLFPFIKQIGWLAERLVPEGKASGPAKLTAYIDERQFRIPQVALQEAFRELYRLGEVTAQMLDCSRRAMLKQDTEALQWVLDHEDGFVDPVCKALDGFINGLLRTNLSLQQQRCCFQIKNLITDIERVGDLTEDMAEAAQKRIEHQVVFSPQALEDIERLYRHAHTTYMCALEALRDRDREKARHACDLEEEFDHLYLEARQDHIRRLEEGVCTPEADVIFVEWLRNLERISDHADNLGVSVSRN